MKMRRLELTQGLRTNQTAKLVVVSKLQDHADVVRGHACLFFHVSQELLVGEGMYVSSWAICRSIAFCKGCACKGIVLRNVLQNDVKSFVLRVNANRGSWSLMTLVYRLASCRRGFFYICTSRNGYP